MGMFDDLKCEMPLPDGAPSGGWQTKSLNCEMSQLAIRADGQLVDQHIRMEKKPGAPEQPAFLSSEYLPWYREWFEEKRGPDELINYTGEVRFYTMKKPTDEWWEFCAFFRDGKCFEIVQIAPAPTES